MREKPAAVPLAVPSSGNAPLEAETIQQSEDIPDSNLINK